MAKMQKNPEDKPREATFTKEQLVASQKYASRCDLLSALLKDGAKYTTSAVDAKIDRFMKGVM